MNTDLNDIYPEQERRALVEALLFASAKPVALNEIVKKLRAALRRRLKLIEPVALPAESLGSDEQSHSGSSTLPDEDFVFESANDDQVVLHTQADADNTSSAAASTSMTESAQTTLVPESDSDANDVLGQLLNKQQELEVDISASDVKLILRAIEDDYKLAHHGIELVTVAKGYQIRTKVELTADLIDDKIRLPKRLSQSSLETLAIVAYQQPISRQKLEEVRGVDSGGVIKTLLDREFVHAVGRSDEPGHPLLYGTTKRFLEAFSINHLSDLPSLSDFMALQVSAGDDAETSENETMSAVADLVADGVVSEWADQDDALLSELSSSIDHVKQVELEVFPPQPVVPTEGEA